MTSQSISICQLKGEMQPPPVAFSVVASMLEQCAADNERRRRGGGEEDISRNNGTGIGLQIGTVKLATGWERELKTLVYLGSTSNSSKLFNSGKL